jgi:hypothetical protein
MSLPRGPVQVVLQFSRARRLFLPRVYNDYFFFTNLTYSWKVSAHPYSNVAEADLTVYLHTPQVPIMIISF